MVTTDFLIIGGGVIGINIARGLKRLYPDERVIVIEKEPSCGLHASGRNSGVLHAGFYYSPDSLKAKFTKVGNQRLTAYCESRNIPLNRCGKLVVAKDERELSSLDELLKRAKANEILLDDISEREAKEIEPRVKTWNRALFSPSTSTVDPTAVMSAMVRDAELEGVDIRSGVAFLDRRAECICTTDSEFQAGYVVNAAGLYADKVAKSFGFSERYCMLPFKGLYLYAEESSPPLRTNIYPVPDLRNPFLGVHFTLTGSGKVKIGPTAIPAFWREQYGGMNNFSLKECLEITSTGLGLLGHAGFEFRRLAAEEVLKYSRRRMVRLAGELLEGVRPDQFRQWGKPGIRAQLLDVRKRRLEMDFVVEGDDRSMHVLNAVSPAFTCSMPFADYVCNRIQATVLN